MGITHPDKVQLTICLLEPFAVNRFLAECCSRWISSSHLISDIDEAMISFYIRKENLISWDPEL